MLDIRALGNFILMCINWQKESINFFKLLPYKRFLFICHCFNNCLVGGEYIFAVFWISP